MPEPVLRFEAVSRRFARRVALDGLDLTLEAGAVLGLVGHNGAGKTTALRVAGGQLWPDAGRVSVLGLDPLRDGLALRERVSRMLDESELHAWMTVGELLAFAAATHPRWDAAHAERLRARLDLDPHARVGELSRGGRAKAALLIAVAPRPEILLLDDPTAGLDPLVRREVLDALIETQTDGGGAVIYASHLVHDLERVADRIVLIERGRAVIDAPIDALRERVRRVVAVFEEPASAAPPRWPGVLDLRSAGRVLELVTDGAAEPIERELRACGAHHVSRHALSLEEILVTLLRGRPGAGPSAAEVPHV